MQYETLITPSGLNRTLGDENWAVIDCRFSLGNPEFGRAGYLRGHIAGAVYAHLEKDLSGPIVPGRSGRHPLPAVEAFVETLSRWGIDSDVQVVVYDDAGGAIAARLWWMLTWVGHDAVALLDGGWQAWASLDLAVRSGDESRPRRQFLPSLRPAFLACASEVAALRSDPSCRLLDARSAVRFRGEQEPIDPIAGHIPGAVSAPYEENLGSDGAFLPPDRLRRRFEKVLGNATPENIVCYCGSGVTAAHNLLALAHAGIGRSRLYAGSWSEWITDPKNPVATGTD
jgi:thiosulfate/3-mercaptopyruvate sulfurtransferase